MKFEPNAAVAVAVSGGPDSMALLHLLNKYTRVVAVTVDHGLRRESAAEIKAVAEWCKKHKIEHYILKWRGAKPKTAVHEAARAARYELFEKFCRAKNILHLATAHHADDQAETILQRIAKASGPAGLAGIAEHSYTPHLHLWRPLLGQTKADLVKYCETYKIPFAQDSSNDNLKYARARLRSAADVLAAEGLTSTNLNLLGTKQRDANAALEQETAEFLAAHARLIPGKDAQIDVTAFAALPITVQQMALDYTLKLTSQSFAPIRYDSLRNLCENLTAANFRPKTLGHCRVAIKKIQSLSRIIIIPE